MSDPAPTARSPRPGGPQDPTGALPEAPHQQPSRGRRGGVSVLRHPFRGGSARRLRTAGSHPLVGHIKTTRRFLALVVLAMIVTACGLSNRERYVAETNAQIEKVYEESEALARAIYELPDEPSGPESFSGVISAYESYRVEVERLNVLVHRLGEVVPELTDHLAEHFDPAVADTHDSCNAAVSVFQSPSATEDEYQEALTSMCLCIERYAEAVTEVSRAYARIGN